MTAARGWRWWRGELALWLGQCAWRGWLVVGDCAFAVHDFAVRRVLWWQGWVRRRDARKDRLG